MQTYFFEKRSRRGKVLQQKFVLQVHYDLFLSDMCFAQFIFHRRTKHSPVLIALVAFFASKTDIYFFREKTKLFFGGCSNI